MTQRSSLERFVPRVASEWDLDVPGARSRQIDGTLCFVDISGFTNLSERLARRGRIGAEELTDVLDRVFGRMLRLAYDRGGSLLKFGGDALLLMFEGDNHPMQGACAAVEMRSALREATTIPTSVGRINLRMSVGLHTGPIDLYLVGDSHRELIITGETATTTTEMEAAASAGEILVSTRLAELLPRSAAGDPKGPGVLLRWRKPGADPVGPQLRTVTDPEVMSGFVPTLLRSHLVHGVAEPEHRVATVAFVKFKGIANAMAAGGRDRVAEDLDELLRITQEAVDSEEVTFLATDIDADGGKIILTAGAPLTREDNEGRMLRAVRRIADHETGLAIRIGVNRGHVFAGEIGTDFRSTYTVMGDTVNLAARLMAAAPIGEVYAAPTVLDRSRTLFGTTALEPFFVKGKSEPVQAFSMGAERGMRSMRADIGLPFTGRNDELAAVHAAIDRVMNGSTEALTIVGETGMGKTRLVDEALRGTAASVFRIQGEVNGVDNTYWALRDPLRQLLAIERRSQEEMAIRLAEEVGKLDESLLPLLPLLGDVTHIDIPETPETAAIEPRFRPDRTAAALSSLIVARLDGPLVLVAEDHHWLDEATSSLLVRMQAESRPRLLLATTRPPAPLESTQIIELGPLDAEPARSIAAAATEAAPLRSHDLDAIVSRAGGNPLFLEEILRLIRETGNADALPDSLDAVVGAEIDTLPPLARRLLRYSSVLGRSFRRVVLDELLAPEDVELDAATRQDLSQFIAPEGSERWRFRHAVMHDAAYQGLSFHKRKELHARAGRVIETLAGVDTTAVAEFLALHYSQAGEHHSAWRYGVIAGDKARQAFANAEAAAHYRRALDSARRHSGATNDERAAVWKSLGDVQQQASEYEAARASFETAMRLVGTTNPDERADLLLRRARAKMRMGRYSAALADITRGERTMTSGVEGAAATAARLESFRAVIRVTQEKYDKAIAAGHRAERIARETEESEALARAYTALDWAYYMSGQAQQAVYGGEALEIYQRLGQPDKVSEVMINQGAWAYYEGRWDDAVEWYERAKAESRRSGNDIAAVGAAMNIAELRIGQSRFDDAEPDVMEAIRTFRAAGDPYGSLFAEMQLGRLMAGRGQTAEAVEAFDRLAHKAIALGQLGAALEAVTHKANALTASGRPDVALSELAQAEIAAGPEASLLKASVARARAEAYAALGQTADAAHHITAGLESARANDLAYDEVLLLDLRDQVGVRENEDAERRLSLRIQLGMAQIR
jgi:class 3 adenylate cyclase/tetratricopeptide (TPR) repeat protein